MNQLATIPAKLPAMSPEAVDKVRRLTDLSLAALPQVPFVTRHLIHGGMYVRTMACPAETIITGALIKRATVLILQGDAIIYTGGEPLHVNGYSVVPGSAGRKQAILCRSDVSLSVICPTDAKTVAEAEMQFTDEFELLWPLSDTERHRILITGE